MACKRSVTTKTGTFTFFPEWVTKCQAEKKCWKRGEILAPISNRRDAKKIMNLFESNIGKEGCLIATNAGANYWIGLDVSYTQNDQQKIFSNGMKWKPHKHGKIYSNHNDEYTNCAISLFDPIITDDPFILTTEGSKCDWTMQNFYACLKPASNATAESVVQDNESYENGTIELPSVAVFAIGAIAGVFAGVFIGFRLQNRKHEKAETRRAQTGLTKVSLAADGGEENIQKSTALFTMEKN